jgi:endoglucanase
MMQDPRANRAARAALTASAGVLAVVLALSLSAPAGHGQEAQGVGNNEWWRGGFRGWRRPNPQAGTLPLVRVQGNAFVDADGEPILFRGLAISDPDKLAKQGHWTREHFEQVKEMGAMVVRIPVHPVAWRDRTPEGYLALLDQAVEWCTEMEMYVMIDWHSIGNLGMELVLADDRPALPRPQHRGLLRAVQRAHRLQGPARQHVLERMEEDKRGPDRPHPLL